MCTDNIHIYDRFKGPNNGACHQYISFLTEGSAKVTLKERKKCLKYLHFFFVFFSNIESRNFSTN